MWQVLVKNVYFGNFLGCFVQMTIACRKIWNKRRTKQGSSESVETRNNEEDDTKTKAKEIVDQIIDMAIKEAQNKSNEANQDDPHSPASIQSQKKTLGKTFVM